jgi:hypothetical protein
MDERENAAGRGGGGGDGGAPYKRLTRKEWMSKVQETQKRKKTPKKNRKAKPSSALTKEHNPPPWP